MPNFVLVTLTTNYSTTFAYENVGYRETVKQQYYCGIQQDL